jgi:hypothetical protein
MRSIWADVSVAALMASLTACVSSQQPRCHAAEQAAVADTLYFGTHEPHGVVTNEEWTGFLKDVVTPRFPHGFTVTEGSGQWLSASDAPVRESTHIVYLVHPDDAASDALLARVITEYRTRFSQESVLRVKVRACATC